MGIATHFPNRLCDLPICPCLSGSTFQCYSNHLLDDFATLWLACALLCIVLIDIQDPMSYHEESLMSFAFSSMSCILLNSAVIPLCNTSFCKDGLKAAISHLLNE